MESTKNLPELINAVTSELLRLRYSPVTISKCNAVWQKLLSYTQAKDLLHFSEKLSESFLLEYYKYPADYSGEFPYGTRIALRAVRMLGDYQLYGIILRKRKKQQPSCPDGFTDAIRGFVLYSYQSRNTVKTVERKVFIVKCFIEYLTMQNVSTCSGINKQHASGFITSILGLKKITINQYLYKLGCFFRFLHSEGSSSVNLRMAIPQINDAKERRIPTVWSPKEKSVACPSHLILRIAYHILLTKEPYKELGTEYLAEREREREQRVIRQLQLKGYQILKVS
ncbi:MULTISPECIES: hypothetical protein [Dehalobacter]|uniref:hypothetical protein n=1 Tax=Dehalobacter TaxID=56112 RepID=UPI00028B705B|nr:MULTISPECIES: hypothetical protein [unclassified Dehalobacter]AFV02231.1 hypothetical protein DHBDCA_p1202 [Dehalobacter sp. DCA]AFV05273.1 hypothetical protein DCF50_p1267 [Dehalobacter sp. CF]EQB20875.1 hypothetical protein UNSWDHB_1808 [Dehalobacter sp. UNSWDHB]MDJ0306657.1 hypothetical protein [Dehalobacter sp.]